MSTLQKLRELSIESQEAELKNCGKIYKMIKINLFIKE